MKWILDCTLSAHGALWIGQPLAFLTLVKFTPLSIGRAIHDAVFAMPYRLRLPLVGVVDILFCAIFVCGVYNECIFLVAVSAMSVERIGLRAREKPSHFQGNDQMIAL